MGNLSEIEAAVEKLPNHEKQELFLFLARTLRSEGELPPPREFSVEEIQGWIAEDEAGMRAFREQL